jgi:hypothetical protein
MDSSCANSARSGYRIVRGQARRGSRNISGRIRAGENDLPCNLNVLQRWQIYLNIALLSWARVSQFWGFIGGKRKEEGSIQVHNYQG